MNHILHNIALIILCFGIILMTIYITRATSNNYMTQEQQLLYKQNGLRLKDPVDTNIYVMRPSNIFNTMFKEGSIGFGYQSFNVKDETDKIYIKTKKNI